MHIFSTGDSSYDVHRLWKIGDKLPTGHVPIKQLLGDLESRCWGTYAPMDVISNPDRWPENWKRMRKVNLAHPILLCPDGRVADGLHRASRSFVLGKQFVAVRTFPSWEAMELAQVAT